MSRNGLHWSDAQLAQVQGARAQLHGEHHAKHLKYRNERVVWQGQVFDSKKELKQWKWFEQQRLLGAIRAVVRQVSLPLPQSRTRIRVDFMVVENDGKIRWWDSKGVDTDKGKLKRRQVLDGYGITVELC